MAIHVVQLGSERFPNEGLRLGTVRRPPRGVAKKDYARLNWYDHWLPILSPSPATVKVMRAVTDDAQWNRAIKKFQTEMSRPEPSMVLSLLAALSHHANFSVGCYCNQEARCHRSVLRELLKERGARMA